MLAGLHPRPQLRRKEWQSLNGTWEFSAGRAAAPAEVEWHGEIQVPYPPGSPRSGVQLDGAPSEVWYRRRFDIPEDWRRQQLILHFNAVDYEAYVWINGHLAGQHRGGHTPFHLDITAFLVAGASQVAVVKAVDHPREMDKPRGKQDWLDEPHSIWYPRTTGIWQEVWLEPVASVHLAKLRLTPRLDDFSFDIEASIEGETDGLSLDVTLEMGDSPLVMDSWRLLGQTVRRRVHLADPGIDDARERLLWSPEHPHLLEVTLTLRSGDQRLDQVHSYAGMRTIEARDGRFFLNGRPYFLRMVLDQGYWGESFMTPPGVEALKRDVELAKAMGFNGVRKHQKIEDPRYLYWADQLGLLVWTELPSAYSFSPNAIHRLAREWLEVIERDYNHPSVVAWVVFNESWGVPDLPASAQQRHLVEGLYHLTKSLDASRPVIGNDGWEYLVGDLLTIHDYDLRPDILAARYRDRASVERTVSEHMPNGRVLALNGASGNNLPVLLSEFGGIRLGRDGDGWGYGEVENPQELLEAYSQLVGAATSAGLSGFCYTQFADTFQEQNGLLFSDRTPKINLADLAWATRHGAPRKGDTP